VILPGSGGTVTFKYDPFGRRVQKNGPAGTTNYLYDGANVVTDLNSTGAVVASYAQGSGIDEPLASLSVAGTAFFEADGLGSVTSL
jgi:YD repeat-containing protein